MEIHLTVTHEEYHLILNTIRVCINTLEMGKAYKTDPETKARYDASISTEQSLLTKLQSFDPNSQTEV